MASGESKTIDTIDDVSEMIEVMKALGIPWKPLKGLDQMKSQVKMKLSQVRNWLPNKCECQSNQEF